MRIVQIVPGSGDAFYCENCVRDAALVGALRDAGHDVVVVPLYLPVGFEDGTPIFYGGINAALQQRFALFRNTPGWLDRIFDARPLLRFAARRAGSVRASALGEMTLSVLRGPEGSQAKELARLLRWLQQGPRPDVVHLSSSLLAGIGAAVKARLGVPLVCSLQDEDAWLDAMEEPARGRCWAAMTEAGRCVDAFVAVSRAYADVMGARMKIEPGRLRVVHVGVDPAGFAPAPAPPEPPAIGYLGRLCESLGLDLLAEAFVALKRTERWRRLRLHLCGGLTADDAPFVESRRRLFAQLGWGADVTIFNAFDPPRRREFLAGLSILSVPAPGGTAFGTFILEALASGVPVVLPRAGAFPEIVEATGGGVLYAPNDPATLARALGELLDDWPRRADLARRGRAAVVEHFSVSTMATRMMEVYRSVAPVPVKT
jgi:glycosyltransferase involved in cell wall biosynthesis